MTSLRERLEAAKANENKSLNKLPSGSQAQTPTMSEILESAIPPKPVSVSGLSRFRQPVARKEPFTDADRPLPPPADPVIEVPIIPAGPSADIATLRKNLDYLAANIDQRELVGQVVRTIAVQLKSNPVLGEGMIDADFDLLIRGLRKCYIVAARNKSEKRAEKAKKSADADEIGDMMKDLGI